MSSNVNDVLITVTVAGVPLGVFNERGDFEATTDVLKVPQPGGAVKTYASSMRTPGDLTVGRTYEVPRDSSKMPFLFRSQGNARCEVSETALDANGRPIAGAVQRWAGTLSGVAINGTNTRDTGERTLTLTVAVDSW